MEKAIFTVKIPNCTDIVAAAKNCTDIVAAAKMMFEAQIPGIRAEDCVVAAGVTGNTVELTYLLTPHVIDAMCNAGHMCPICSGSNVHVLELQCAECGNICGAK